MYCQGVNCVEKDPDNTYENKELNLKLSIPAYICRQCDIVIYEPDNYATILQAEETAQGRHYVKVEVKNGKVSKYSMH